MRLIVNQPKETIAEFVRERTRGVYPFANFSALGLLEDGKLLAGVVYDHYTPPCIMMHIAAVPTKTWATRDFAFPCFDFPFNQLGCRVVIGLVAKRNKGARRFDEHLGFVLRGTIPEGFADDDMLIYAMRKSECKWLELKKGA